MEIPFLSFQHMHSAIKSEIMQSFEAFYDSYWYVLGKNVEAFEAAYSEFNKVPFTVGLSNGLDALHIALKTLGIGKGHEVIVPSNTYIATLLAVSYTGAKPVLVEPDENTYNIDPAKIEEAITSRTKAIMPVHLYGQACQMDTILEIANRYNLFVVEDNAQSQGATFNGKLTGSFGHINGTSFYPGKNLGALGDAGAITTTDKELAEKAKLLRNYGSAKKYHHETIGFNMRLDECQAGFLTIKLKYLEKWTRERISIANLYNSYLSEVSDISLPATHKKASHVYHLYVIRSSQRDKLQEYLAKQGIGSLIHYPIPPHLQKAYNQLGYKAGSLPISEGIANTCLSLPLYPGLTESAVQQVAEAIKNFHND